MQASVEAFDFVVRLGSNVVSFTRLAAFGLTHAALGLLVWEGTRALWGRGGVLAVAGVILFAAGTALAFSLEALVAAIQALRLEYYELFSRVFVAQGRPFRPWHVPTATGHVAAAAEGKAFPRSARGQEVRDVCLADRVAADRRRCGAGAVGRAALASRRGRPGR